MHENEITASIVDTSFAIHKRLGPGLLESVYRRILGFELVARGMRVQMEHAIPVRWHDKTFEFGFRADIIVNEKVIVETKSVEAVHPVHKMQLLTYLRLAHLPVGLLINFNVDLFKNGIHRVANGLVE